MCATWNNLVPSINWMTEQTQLINLEKSFNYSIYALRESVILLDAPFNFSGLSRYFWTLNKCLAFIDRILINQSPRH